MSSEYKRVNCVCGKSYSSYIAAALYFRCECGSRLLVAHNENTQLAIVGPKEDEPGQRNAGEREPVS